MPIDARIAMGVRPPQFEPRANALAQMLQLQGAQQQNQLAGMQMEEHRANAAEKNALRAILGSGLDLDTPEGQRKLYGAAPTQAGAILKGRLDLRKTEGDIAKTKAETGKVQTEAIEKKLDLHGRAISGLSSPQAAQQWIQQGFADPEIAKMFGGPEAMQAALQNVPQTQAEFEAWRGRQALGFLSVKDRLEQGNKDRSFALDVGKFGETQTHNRNTEKVAQGNLAVNQAQLGISRGNLSVAQQRLNLEKNAPKGVLDHERGLVVDPRTGAAIPITQGGVPVGAKDKNLTDAQAKANLFGTRMQEADKIITSLEGKYSPLAVNAKTAADAVPGAGMVANWMLSAEGQQAEQAQRDFVNAVLRRESGAVISDSEFSNARKQYFPQPNDKPEALKQKAMNRKIAMEGVIAEVPANKRGVPSLTNPSKPGGATGGWEADKEARYQAWKAQQK